jgi:hypothetical protein
MSGHAHPSVTVPHAIRQAFLALAFLLTLHPWNVRATPGVPASGQAVTVRRDIGAIMPAISNPPVALQVKPYDPANTVAKAGYSAAAMPSVTPEFQQFRTASAKVTYETLVQSGAVVKATRGEFQRMQEYVENAYHGVTVLKTISVSDESFDCIPLVQQPSLRGGQTIDSPPGPPLVAAAQSVSCDAGSIPFKRLNLSDLAAYPTLEQFLAKGKTAPPSMPSVLTPPANAMPSATQILPAPNDVHYYAHVSQNAWGKFNGAGADLSIWNPNVDPQLDAYRMSLMQIWLLGQSQEGLTESLEVGWQTQPLAWHTPLPGAFVYWTADGYNSTGCYDLECAGFVQTSSALVFSAPFARDQYSVPGGRQPTLNVEWQRKADTSNWWLIIDGEWIGYIPASMYNGELSKADGYRFLDAGGEIAAPDNLPSLPMGSGQFAAAGYQKAAFVTNMHTLDTTKVYQPVDLAQTVPDATPGCYTVALAGVAPDVLGFALPDGVSTVPDLAPGMTGTSFYLGGPGMADAACNIAYSTAPAPVASALVNGKALNGLAGASGSNTLYRITVPVGAHGLNIRTFGGSGKVALYVRQGMAPTADGHDNYSSTRPGSTQSIVVAQPLATTYYILLAGNAGAYSDVNLQASFLQ